MKVWDGLVRLLHWLLVLAVGAAWLGGDRDWHEPLGYIALCVVALRIVWGFAGSRYARFAQFVRGPVATWRYARLWTAAREPRYLGHNPLGAWMVLTLLGLVVAVGVTGWLCTIGRYEGETLVRMGQLHRLLAWSLVCATALHVGGVVVTGARHRERLVRAMLTGRKPAPVKDDVT